MKRKLKMTAALVVLSACLCSCAKVWEEERVERRPRKQVEIEPIKPPDWDPKNTSNQTKTTDYDTIIDAGNEGAPVSDGGTIAADSL